MNRIVNVLKATYNFFVGDAILLAAVVVAFLLATLFLHALTAPGFGARNVIAAVLLIVSVVAGLAATLGRELMAHRK
jgi:hypothetical protein